MVYKRLIFTLLLCIYTGLHAAPMPKKPWTFLVYLAGVNSLNDFIESDLSEMKKVGSNNHVNVLVYCHRLKKNNKRVTQLIYVEKGKLTILKEINEDSGDVKTLMNALKWALTEYPSDHIVVDLWNHGSGILNKSCMPTERGICYDDLSGNYLTDRDCLQAFKWAQETYRNGKKFDVIACDACLMAMVEYAYTLKDCTQYLVASEETIPGYGYDYAFILKTFEKNVLSARACAENLVTAYKDEYQGTTEYTLSAIDTTKVQPLVHNLSQCADFFYTALQSERKKDVYANLKKASQLALSFSNGIYLDIVSFYSALDAVVGAMKLDSKKEATIHTLLQHGIALVHECVVKNATSNKYKQASGLTMYFPITTVDASYAHLYWTEKNPIFAKFFVEYIKNAEKPSLSFMSLFPQMLLDLFA